MAGKKPTSCRKCSKSFKGILKTKQHYHCNKCGDSLCKKCGQHAFAEETICAKCDTYLKQKIKSKHTERQNESSISSSSTTSNNPCYWENVSNFPSKYPSNLIQLNDYEFISAPSSSGDPFSMMYQEGIYKYDIRLNKWELFILYPDDFRTSSHVLNFNKSTNLLYLHGYEVFMAEFDIIQKQFIRQIPKSIYQPQGRLGYLPSCVMAEDQYHMISGKKNKKHLIFNKQREMFEVKHTFKLKYGMVDHSIIYLSKRKQILVFGGLDKGTYVQDFRLFDIIKNKWGKKIKQKILHTNGNNFYIQSVCIVPTADERYVLIFGGRNRYQIDILDLNNMAISTSKVVCPFSGTYCVSKTINTHESMCIVNGYIRMVQKNEPNLSETISCLPIDIIKTIEIWYRTTNIHLLKRNTGEHWKIALDYILQIDL